MSLVLHRQPVEASQPTGELRALLRHFPGPALLLDGLGRVWARNAAAGPLHETLGAPCGAGLRSMVARCLSGSGPQAGRLRLDETADAAFDITLVPLQAAAADGPAVLLLARDASAEVRLINSLVESRRLYKDLVACSADIAWETDADGAFVFVSPAGMLGYAPGELTGVHPRALLDERSQDAGPLPFEGQSPSEDVELWFRGCDGAAACLLVSSVPVIRAGAWTGARGVCRDVTAQRLQQAALAQAERREDLVNAVVDAMRAEIEPEEMLRRAAESAVAALGLAACRLYRVPRRGEPVTIAQVGEAPAPDAALLAEARSGGPLRTADAAGGVTHLLVGCTYRGIPKGVLCFTVAAGDALPDDKLGRELADHVAVAVAQAEAHDRLERLSMTDELTGLLNRRAFAEAAGRRLAHLHRLGRPGALFFFDLDNFKAVNDSRGHEAGDAVLRAFAQMLRDNSRAGDVVARLGGDEFALWAEETAREGAVAKAENVLREFQRSAALNPGCEPPLGVSIGVALTGPNDVHGLEGLMHEADVAMYRTKHRGRNGFALAAAGEGEERC